MIVFSVVSVIPTKPRHHNGNAVCPLGTVEYFCTANYDELGWIFNGTRIALYRSTGKTSCSDSTILETALDKPTHNAGKHTLTSTATIESVQIEYNGLLIECYDIGGVDSQEIRVKGIRVVCACIYLMHINDAYYYACIICIYQCMHLISIHANI